MNKHHHRPIFNKSRGCMMAVAETASSCSKSPSRTSKARSRLSKCFKTSKNGQLYLSKVPLAQWIRAQAAPDLIVFVNRTDNQFNPAAAKNVSSKGKGSSNAQDTSFTNTSVSAGNACSMAYEHCSFHRQLGTAPALTPASWSGKRQMARYCASALRSRLMARS